MEESFSVIVQSGPEINQAFFKMITDFLVGVCVRSFMLITHHILALTFPMGRNFISAFHVGLFWRVMEKLYPYISKLMKISS